MYLQEDGITSEWSFAYTSKPQAARMCMTKNGTKVSWMYRIIACNIKNQISLLPLKRMQNRKGDIETVPEFQESCLWIWFWPAVTPLNCLKSKSTDKNKHRKGTKMTKLLLFFKKKNMTADTIWFEGLQSQLIICQKKVSNNICIKINKNKLNWKKLVKDFDVWPNRAAGNTGTFVH